MATDNQSQDRTGSPRIQQCRGADCDAEFMFVQVERRDGIISTMPLNLDSVHVEDPTDTKQLRGCFMYIEDQRVRHAKPGDVGPFFNSHHATCPNADDFRGGSR